MEEARLLLLEVTRDRANQNFLKKLKANIGNMFAGGPLQRVKEITNKLKDFVNIVHLGVSLE